MTGLTLIRRLDDWSSRVESAFIDGREVDLNDKQKMLYEKYSAKYRQLGLIE